MNQKKILKINNLNVEFAKESTLIDLIFRKSKKTVKAVEDLNLEIGKGEIIGQLLAPELVSNLEFGGKEGNILYVTATSSLYCMELNQIGAKFT